MVGIDSDVESQFLGIQVAVCNECSGRAVAISLNGYFACILIILSVYGKSTIVLDVDIRSTFESLFECKLVVEIDIGIRLIKLLDFLKLSPLCAPVVVIVALGWHIECSSLEVSKCILVDIDRQDSVGIYLVQVAAVFKCIVADTLQSTRKLYFSQVAATREGAF